MSRSFSMTPYTYKQSDNENSNSENSFDKKELTLEQESETNQVDVLSFGSQITNKSTKQIEKK